MSTIIIVRNKFLPHINDAHRYFEAFRLLSSQAFTPTTTLYLLFILFLQRYFIFILFYFIFYGFCSQLSLLRGEYLKWDIEKKVKIIPKTFSFNKIVSMVIERETWEAVNWKISSAQCGKFSCCFIRILLYLHTTNEGESLLFPSHFQLHSPQYWFSLHTTTTTSRIEQQKFEIFFFIHK